MVSENPQPQCFNLEDVQAGNYTLEEGLAFMNGDSRIELKPGTPIVVKLNCASKAQEGKLLGEGWLEIEIPNIASLHLHKKDVNAITLSPR